MARFGVSITKSTPFRNSVQEFSNVYYYNNGARAMPDATEADQLIDELTAIEKTFHSLSVTFVRGRLWSQVGSEAGNEMISQKNLSGTGSTTASSQQDRERAFLFRLRAGSNSRGQPVYLRKWYHPVGNFGTVSPSSGIDANLTALSGAQRSTAAGLMDTITNIGGVLEPWHICAKSGREPPAGNTWECHAWFEHHQLGDMWRAT